MCAAALEVAEVATDDLTPTIAAAVSAADVARYERIYAACAQRVRTEAQRGLATLPQALQAGITAEDSQEQIAARLGVTVGAVKMRKWRVREELRAWVAESRAERRMVEALP